MRLIDANSILDNFLKRYTEMERDGKLVFAACEIKQDFADMVSNAPTVDAVEVVRCKDCKYCVKWNEIGYCDNPDGLDNYAHPEDFCSYGVRKEGAE